MLADVLQRKGLAGRCAGEKVTGRGGKMLGELEGLPGGRTWAMGHRRAVPTTGTIIAHRYS